MISTISTLMKRVMRSFTSCQALDMDRLCGLSLLLIYLPVVESIRDCLSQPTDIIWKKIGDRVVLNCTVHSHCSAKDLRYEWFAFKENIHLRLDLKSIQSKYTLDGASLKINSLNINDSGIYHCAAVLKTGPAHNAQYIAMGTPLEVKEVIKTVRQNMLLYLSCVLLAIYSLAVVCLFILKKYGYNIYSSKRMQTSDKTNSTRKKQFRDVLQEMYSKRNLERSKKTVRRTASSSHVEAASADDIYQNV